MAEQEKTTGEKYYGRLKFMTGEVFILAATAAIAYVARYGQDTYKGVPNYLKKFQNWFEKLFEPMMKKGGAKEVIGGAAASTMVTFHGGNLFAPPMKWFENGKKRMVDYFNRKFGAPGEEEIGHERLKDEPTQTWGDVITGRLAAWATVFTSFVSATLIVGKNDNIKRAGKNRGEYYFDLYEEKVGRWLTGFTKGGKEIAATPLAKELTEVQKKNTTYRFGKILALDVFATTAALIIWGSISKALANRRKKKHAAEVEMAAAPLPAPVIEEPQPERRFTDDIRPRAQSHTEMVATQQAAAETAQRGSA